MTSRTSSNSTPLVWRTPVAAILVGWGACDLCLSAAAGASGAAAERQVGAVRIRRRRKDQQCHH